MAKWTEADRNRFDEHCILAAVGAGFKVEEQRLLPLEEKGYVKRKVVFEITEKGRQHFKDVSLEIEKVSKEAIA